jgi:hypothetical protein
MAVWRTLPAELLAARTCMVYSRIHLPRPVPAMSEPNATPSGACMITFACPTCQKKLSVKDELAGKKGKCPGCGQTMAIPAPVALGPAVEEMWPLSPALEVEPFRQALCRLASGFSFASGI